jgi:hypothetical protein
MRAELVIKIPMTKRPQRVTQFCQELTQTIMTDIFSSGYGPVEVAFSLAHLAKEWVRESCATTIAVRRPVLQRGQQG